VKLSLIALCLVTAACATLSCNRSMSLDSSELAKCMTRKGIKLYSLDDCSACEMQKSLFGVGFGYLKVVNCSDEEKREECFLQEIRSVPAWRRPDGGKLAGVHGLGALAEWSGCR